VAGNFHLLAQMKVTKAKGPNTIWPSRFGKKVRPAQCGSTRSGERLERGAKAFALRVGRALRQVEQARRQPNSPAEASGSDRIEALCFGDFHLGQQMKVTGDAGPGPGGLSRDERN
jgi:hypothetical protein